MGVELLYRTPGCQVKRHLCEYVGERGSKQLGSLAGAS